MKTKICEILSTDELLIDHEYDQTIMIEAVERIFQEFKTGKYDVNFYTVAFIIWLRREITKKTKKG